MIFMILRLLFIIASNLYCIPAYFAWMLVILPFRALIPRLYDAIEGTLFSWLLMIVSSWIWLGNVTGNGIECESISLTLSKLLK